MKSRTMVIALLALTGCGVTLGEFGVLTGPGVVPSSIEPLRGDSVRVEGKSCGTSILLIPWSSSHIDDAVGEAVQRSGGQPLHHVTIRRTFTNTLLVDRECVIVEGFFQKPPGASSRVCPHPYSYTITCPWCDQMSACTCTCT